MANFVPTQQYESSSESDNDMETNQQDIEQAQMAIKQEKQWSRYIILTKVMME